MAFFSDRPKGRHGRQLLLSLLAVCVIVAGGCDGDGRAEGVPPPTLPAMVDAEPAVAAQFENARQRLAAARSNEDLGAEELGALYGEIGQLLHAYQFNDHAAVAYASAAELTPDDFRWPYLLAQLARARQDDPEQERQLRAALTLRDDYAPLHFWLGKLRRTSEPSEARPHFERTLALDPSYAAAFVELALLAVADGHPDEAIEHLDAAAELQPGTYQVRFARVEALRAAGRITEARALGESLRPAVERLNLQHGDPLMMGVASLQRNVGWYLRRGRRNFFNGRLELALTDFETAHELAPGRNDVVQNLASARIRVGDLAGARALLEPLVEREPDYLPGLRVRLLLARREGDAAGVRDLESRIAALAGEQNR